MKDICRTAELTNTARYPEATQGGCELFPTFQAMIAFIRFKEGLGWQALYSSRFNRIGM